MKRVCSLILAISLIFLMSGCSLFNSSKSKPTSSKASMLNEKDKINQNNADFKSKVDAIRTTYQTKRAQADNQRLSKRNADIQYYENNRLNAYNAETQKISGEIAQRNQESQKLLSTKYAASIAQMLGGTQNSSQILGDYAQNVYNTKLQSANIGIAFDRAKRAYENQVQQAKDLRDKNESDFKYKCTQKYDKLFANVNTLYVGQDSEWEVLVRREQKELTDFYAKEDKKYNGKIAEIDKWRDEAFQSLVS